MDLKKKFDLELKKRNYDQRIEIIHTQNNISSQINSESIKLALSCKKFQDFLTKNLLQSKSDSKGTNILYYLIIWKLKIYPSLIRK